MSKINDDTERAGGRLRAILRASIVAICTNVALAIFKAIVGIVTNSIAITMDAINNFTDAGSSLITILSSSLASKDPDKKHPFGHGRTEYLGTLLIAVIILYAGVTSFVESVKGIIHPEMAEYSTISLVIIIVAVFAKAGLAFYTTKVGKRVNSDSLVASGKDAIGDIAISSATVVAAFVFLIWGLSVEAWLGAIIAALIIKTGAEILMDTVAKLLGMGAEAELVRNIKKAVVAHEGVVGAFDVVLHDYGPDSYLGSLHIEVEDTLPVSKFDELSRTIQEDITEQFGVYLSAIGVYSVNTKDSEVIALREDVKSIALSFEHVKQLHGFYVDEARKNMRFDIVISFEAQDRRKVYNDVLAKIGEKYPTYIIKAGMDMDYNEI